jgi:hypothetical protein
VCGWDDRIKIKHLQHTHTQQWRTKKIEQSLQKAQFFFTSFSRFIGLSYLWKGKGGACGLLGLLSLFFFERGSTVCFFGHACVHAAYGWREKTASGISMYCRLLGKYDAPLTNDDLIPED